MKIVADENIPLVSHYFGSCGEIVTKSGRDITQKDLLSADILLVRAVTRVDENLLRDTPIKFVGSATAGADHLDTKWLDRAGIAWSTAAGCNAVAVSEYIVCTIAFLQKSGFLKKEKLRAGVIGVGNAGREVVNKLEVLGFDVIYCDPLRAEKEKEFHSTPLNEFNDLDLVTLHVPLTKETAYPTCRLIEKDFLQRQKKNCILLNTSRGEVINSNDLKIYGEQSIWCLDVFENEPFIDLEIINSAVIATPHIAGYSVQSKYRGITMIYTAAIKNKIIPEKKIGKIEFPTQKLNLNNEKVDWRDLVLKIYDPSVTTLSMKNKLVGDKNAFDLLRKNFVNRHEFAYTTIEGARLDAEDKVTVERLGIKVLLNKSLLRTPSPTGGRWPKAGRGNIK